MFIKHAMKNFTRQAPVFRSELALTEIRGLRYILFSLAMLTFCLGLLDLTFWYGNHYFGWPVLPQALALHANAAWCFVISGLSLFSIVFQRWHSVMACTVLLALSSISALCLNLFDFTGFVHQSLLIFATGTLTSEPLSLGATGGFLATTLALLQVRRARLYKLSALWLAIFSTIVIAFSLIILFDKHSNVVEEMMWHHIHFGHVLAAVLMMGNGVALLMLATQNRFHQQVYHYAWLSKLACALVILLSVFFWQALLFQRNMNIHRLTHMEANSIKNEIADKLDASLYLLKTMALRLQRHERMPLEKWTHEARSLLKEQRYFTALTWLGPNRHVRWMVPQQGGARSVALRDLFNRLARRQHKDERAINVSHRIQLPTGDSIYLITIPLHFHERFAGYLVGTLDARILLHKVFGTNISPGYNVAVRDNGLLVVERLRGDEHFIKQWSEEVLLNHHNLRWSIIVWPTYALLQVEKSILPDVILVLGLILGLLLAFAIHFAQMASHRARQLLNNNHRLQKEIRARTQAEQAKGQLEQALLQSQKMEALGTLSGGIAHDFNNILYSIKGYVDLALGSRTLDVTTQENLQKVLTVSERGQELIASLMAFSRKETRQLEPIELLDFLETTLLILKPSLAADLDFVVQMDIETGQVLGHKTELQQLLVNIINNAQDAMDEGHGQLQLQVSLCHLADSLPGWSLKSGEYYCLAITDNGIGMDKATQERIFEPFFTTKEVGSGTGLGLATAYGIIKTHHGALTVDSTPGRGTTFRIYLPKLTAE